MYLVQKLSKVIRMLGYNSLLAALQQGTEERSAITVKEDFWYHGTEWVSCASLALC